MKVFLPALVAVALFAAPAAAIEFYRDSKDNLYFEGLPPGRLISIYYQSGARLRTVWMYRDSLKSCPVHNLFASKRLSFSQIRILNAAPLPIDFQPYSLPDSPQDSSPCSGGQINSSLPWTTIAPGLQAVRLRETTRFSYCRSSLGCTAAQRRPQPVTSVYVAGLPGPAYQVSDLTDRVRFAATDACGMLKLANTGKWAAYRDDQLELIDRRTQTEYGTFSRAGAGARADHQIPRCRNGILYKPLP
jgi:hypothetical protein